MKDIDETDYTYLGTLRTDKIKDKGTSNKE